MTDEITSSDPCNSSAPSPLSPSSQVFRDKLVGGLDATPFGCQRDGVTQSDQKAVCSRGMQIDRFVIVDLVGVGGMGMVYAAYDPELDRKVALKLLLPRADDPADTQRARNLREAQALARLAHPNVVAVYDVGMHDGLVWIAMEFVAGQTLGIWAKGRRQQRWPDVLRILLDVAHGVAAAHAVGLVHRDLKPENVMIDESGRVRVMDFGLAHARTFPVDSDEFASTVPSDSASRPHLAALTLQLTRSGTIQGTPAYMAPEQWLGRDVDAAADQFGWSVMAWELLYGERPFSNVAEMLSDPRSPRPSPRGRGVPRWLRRVVERGLSTDPAQRWPTMEALLFALKRGRMHAWMQSTTLAVAGIVVLVVGGTAYQRLEVAQRVNRCEAEGAIIDSIWNDNARQKIREAFMATGVAFAEDTAAKVMPWLSEHADKWSRATTDICLKAEFDGTWSEDIIERAEWCLRDRQMEFESLVADLGEANRITVQKSVLSAANLRLVTACLDRNSLLHQPVPPTHDREVLRDVRARLLQSSSFGLAGNYDESLRAATAAREQAKTLDWPPLWAAARAQEGEILSSKGAFAEAEKASIEAYLEAGRFEQWETAAVAATHLIHTVGAKQARHADGRLWAQHAEMAIALAGGREELLEARRLNNLAVVHKASGAYADAMPLFERALAIHENALGPRHPTVANSLSNLAGLHLSKGSHASARALLERALAIRAETMGNEHPSISVDLTELARVHCATEAYGEALPLFERALAIDEKVFGFDHPNVADRLNNLAGAHLDSGDHAKALPLFERALAIREKALGAEHPDFAASLANLGNYHFSQGAYKEARVLHERALSVWEKALGPEHPNVATGLNNLAIVYQASGMNAEARALLERALAVWEKVLGHHHINVAICLSNLADAHEATGAYDEARRLRERALNIQENALGADHPMVARTLRDLANVHAAEGAYGRALPLYDRALAIQETALSPSDPEVASTLTKLAALYLADNKPQDALPRIERAVVILDTHEGVQGSEIEAHFILAKSLVEARGDRVRGIVEARRALNGLGAAGLAATAEFAEVEQWLLKVERRK